MNANSINNLAVAMNMLEAAGFNPRRSPARVSKLARVLDANPGRSISIETTDGHLRSAGRRIRAAKAEGKTLIGSCTFRHAPSRGQYGHCELVFAVVE